MLLQDAIKLLLSVEFVGDDLLNDFIFVLVHGDVRISDVWSWLREKPSSHAFVIKIEHVVLLVRDLAVVIYLAHFEA